MLQLILQFSWRNIWRNQRRTMLTLLAITIGMISLIFGRAYIAGTLQAMLEPTIRLYSGHIRICHPEYLRMERTLPKEFLVHPLSSVQEEIAALPGISSQHELLKFNALVAHESQNEVCQIMGINATEDSKGPRMSEFIRRGTFLTKDPRSLVIGKGLAHELKADIGDELLLVTTDINHSTYALPFKVSGILEIGISGIDRNGILIHFTSAAEMLASENAAHEILVFCDHREQAAGLARSLRQQLKPVDGVPLVITPWQQNGFVTETLPLIQKAWGAILFILMFLVALVILNTMLMTVMERFKEIGILKALGFKSRDIITMILIEAVYLGIIGTLIGALLGSGLTSLAARKGIDISKALQPGMFDKADIPISFIGSTLHPILTPSMVIYAITFGIVTSLAAVLYPALKSRKMLPVDAFRTELKL